MLVSFLFHGECKPRPCYSSSGAQHPGQNRIQTITVNEHITEAVDSQVARWRTVKYQQRIKHNHSPKDCQPAHDPLPEPLFSSSGHKGRSKNENGDGIAYPTLLNNKRVCPHPTQALPPEEQRHQPEPASSCHRPRDLICSKEDKGKYQPQCPPMVPPVLGHPETGHPEAEGPSQQKLPGLPAVAKSLSCLALQPLQGPYPSDYLGKVKCCEKNLWPSRLE